MIRKMKRRFERDNSLSVVVKTTAVEENLKPLFIALIQECVTSLYEVRDSVTDWEELIQYSISMGTEPLHANHIQAISTVTSQLASIVKDYLNHTLSPLTWYLDNSSSRPVTPLSEEAKQDGQVGKRVPMTDADFDYKNTEGSPFSVLAKKNVMILDGLGVMCGYLARSLDKKKEDYDNLTKRVEQMRADKMNQTLYALTLVTAFSVPMGFFTGLFGMNFSDMYFLDPQPEGTIIDNLGLAGFRLFLWLLLGSMGLIFYLFNRMGLFNGLF